MASIVWTLADLNSASDRLADRALSPDERARLEEIVDLRRELLADAQALGFRLAPTA